MAKLAGANMLVILAAALAVFGIQQWGMWERSDIGIVLAVALGVTFAVNAGLMVLALRPLQELEHIVERVRRGELHARVQGSALSDSRMTRVGETLNLLLDELLEDRARARRLATEIIGAGDRERAAIARELHDSVAQSLVALQMQLSVAARDCDDSALTQQLEEIRTIGTDAFDEVRMLAHTMHPRVLDDLGLVPALQYLARRSHESSGTEVVVTAPDDVTFAHVPAPVASVLYRVTQEAVGNAIRHGHAETVNIDVRLSDVPPDIEIPPGLYGMQHWITLTITDNGSGFDVEDAERRRPGMGLFTMRERVAIVDGVFAIHSAPGQGTRIVTSISIDQHVGDDAEEIIA